MSVPDNLIIGISIDAEQAHAEIDRLKAALASVEPFEVEELTELETTWGIPWWFLVAAGAVGGLVVLLAFFLVGTVLS